MPDDGPNPTHATFDYAPFGNDEVGELFDAKPLAGRLILSAMGDWDGKSMASIIRDAGQDGAGFPAASHDIAAGPLFIDQSQIYALGYRTSPHPLRTFDCSECDHVEQIAIANDPMKSDAVGWFIGDPRPPQ